MEPFEDKHLKIWGSIPFAQRRPMDDQGEEAAAAADLHGVQPDSSHYFILFCFLFAIVRIFYISTILPSHIYP